MTSYQELTAGGESSPLFTGCCRAKEVINRDLDGGTEPELTSRDEEGRLEFGVEPGLNGVRPGSLTLCTSLDSPPPHPAPPLPPCNTTLEGFPAPACPHSSRVPWRCRAQGQGSPGCGGYRASKSSNEPLLTGFGSLAELGHTGPETHVAVGSTAISGCSLADVDVNTETFEWMRVKRSQRRAGKFCVCVSVRSTEREQDRNFETYNYTGYMMIAFDSCL